MIPKWSVINWKDIILDLLHLIGNILTSIPMDFFGERLMVIVKWSGN